VQLLQILVSGVALSCTYSLFALGYSLIFSTTGNFHYLHGGIGVAGGVAFYVLTALGGLAIVPSLLLSMLFAALLGVIVNLVVYEPMIRGGATTLGLFTGSLGAYIVLENIITMIFGTRILVLERAGFLTQTLIVKGVYVTITQVLIVAATLLLLGAMYLFVYRTRMGRAIRAMANDPELAEVMGMDTRKVRHVIYGAGSALAGAAAILIGLDLGLIDPFAGPLVLFTSVVAVVVGGMGNIPAATAGGFLLGLIQSLSSWRLPQHVQDTVVFAVLVVIMLVRPTGLFGKRLTALGR